MISHNPNQKLRRPCRRCNRMFIPSGRDNWLCKECAWQIQRKMGEDLKKRNKEKYIIKSDNIPTR